MAIGSKGSFATVQPNQVLDLSSQVDKGFELDREIQKQKRADKKALDEKKQSEINKLKDVGFKSVNNETIDSINIKVANQVRDSLFTIKKKYNNGELSLQDLKIQVQRHNAMVDTRKMQMEQLRPAVENFTSTAAEGNLSRGIGDGLADENISTKYMKGQIENVRVDSQGRVMLSIRDENGEIKEYDEAVLIDYLNNPPLKYNKKSAVSTFAEDFKKRTTTIDGVLLSSKEREEKGIGYYERVKEQGLDGNQIDEINQEAIKAVRDPNYQNDIWHQMTGKEGKVNFNEDDVNEMEQWLSNKMIKETENRVLTELSKTYNISQRNADRAERDRRNNGEKPTKVIQQKPDSNMYSNQANLGDIADDDLQSLKEGVEVPLAENIVVGSVKVESPLGQTTRTNVEIQAITVASNGKVYIRGQNKLDEGGTIKKAKSKGKGLNVQEIKQQLASGVGNGSGEIKTTGETTTKLDRTSPFAAEIPIQEARRILAKAGLSFDDFKTEKTKDEKKNKEALPQIPGTNN